MTVDPARSAGPSAVGRGLSLAYWSGERAWMIAADRHARPADEVSPLLSLPGRHFANTLMDLGVMATSIGDAPQGVIAPANFTGTNTDQTAVDALAGIVAIGATLTASDVSAWLTDTALKDIWTDLVRPSGWHPLPIGVARPSASVLRAGGAASAGTASDGLTRTALTAAKAQTAISRRLFDLDYPEGAIIGLDAAGLIASHGEAGVALRPNDWRAVGVQGAAITGPLIAAFFDHGWWQDQTPAQRRAIEIAADATLHWHLTQQHMAAHFLASARPDLSEPPTESDPDLTRELRACGEACAAAIGASPAASAMVGPLIDLGRKTQPHHSFA